MSRYTTATDSTLAAGRDSLRLPAVPASQLVLVTSSAICSKAASAYGASVGGATSTLSGRVYVVQVGTSRYVVYDPAYQYDPGRPQIGTLVVLDAKYNFLAKFF